MCDFEKQGSHLIITIKTGFCIALVIKFIYCGLQNTVIYVKYIIIPYYCPQQHFRFTKSSGNLEILTSIYLGFFQIFQNIRIVVLLIGWPTQWVILRYLKNHFNIPWVDGCIHLKNGGNIPLGLKLLRTNIDFRVLGTSTATIFLQLIILSIHLYISDERYENFLSTVGFEPGPYAYEANALSVELLELINIDQLNVSAFHLSFLCKLPVPHGPCNNYLSCIFLI